MSLADDFLVDDKGRVLLAALLAERIGRDGPGKIDDALIQYAVCELGYIHIAKRFDGLSVELCASAFSLVTLIGALFAITDHRPSQIFLTVYRDQGQRSLETFTSIGGFANRAEILAQPSSALTSSGFG